MKIQETWMKINIKRMKIHETLMTLHGARMKIQRTERFKSRNVDN